MLLKVLFFAVLIYFVLKTVTRLINAMKGEETKSRLDRDPAPDWQGAAPRRSYDEEDIEDAKFVDV